MPYKDKERQKEYQRQWVAQRRAEWFADKSCVRCSTQDNLQLDHIDPSTKVSHNIWSWSQKNRDEELIKCQVLCTSCHKDKWKENYEFVHGTDVISAKLSETEVTIIQSSILPLKELARLYEVDVRTIRHIKNQTTWRHLNNNGQDNRLEVN